MSTRSTAKRHRFIIAAPILFALAGPAAAQTCHSLTGTWTLDRAGSRLGAGLSFDPYYQVDDIRLALNQTAEGVAQRWTFRGAHIDETDRYTVPADDRETPTGTRSLLNSVPVAVRGSWENCTLLEHGKTSLFGQTIWTTSRYVIDAADQRLSIRQTSHSDLGDVDRLLVFRRISRQGQ